MASRAVALVAGIIDQIEDRPLGTGRPPMPTIKVVETLRFFVREGVQWRELRATARRACGATLRRRLEDWSAVALLRRVHVALLRMVRSGLEVVAWDVVVDSCSVQGQSGWQQVDHAHDRGYSAFVDGCFVRAFPAGIDVAILTREFHISLSDLQLPFDHGTNHVVGHRFIWP